MAYRASNSGLVGHDRLLKTSGRPQHVEIRASKAFSMESDVDTEFEEDASDLDDYQGRRSEESFGNTTVSAFSEERTPPSDDFQGFKFFLPQEAAPYQAPKAVEGPVGPHLFRYSQQSPSQEELYLQWSPIESPTSREAIAKKTASSLEIAPPANVPLDKWNPYQVAGWMRQASIDESLILKFRAHDISGGILRQLQFGDLKELGIVSFGQRHMLWDEIRRLRGGPSMLFDAEEPAICSPTEEPCARQQSPDNECSSPVTGDSELANRRKLARRRARRALRNDDVISPAESASIVAIEQLLPEPHHCSKGENCAKWRKWKRKMDKIAKEFPLELEQIEENKAPSPSELNSVRPASEAVPSVVASSDVLGPGQRPALRLDEDVLRSVMNRDPQENVRRFLDFQHMADSPRDQQSSPSESSPTLSLPANTQAPHSNLSKLPKLQIPLAAPMQVVNEAEKTAIQQHRTPITAVQSDGQQIYRFATPASEMDVPLTAIPSGPVEREISNSVPPDMRYGVNSSSRPSSRTSHRQSNGADTLHSAEVSSQTSRALKRSSSLSQRRHQPAFHSRLLADERQPVLSPIVDDNEDKTPVAESANHAGFMKKRRVKMLRHEWVENYYRLKGTTLAMHRDQKSRDTLDCIDVDDYAVACSTLASSKLNTAFKTLKISSSKKKDGSKEADGSAFAFQLVPATEKKGILGSASGKTHHFAVKNREERIDWMRELMLAKALKQKATEGCEMNLNGRAVS